MNLQAAWERQTEVLGGTDYEEETICCAVAADGEYCGH